MCPKVFLSVVLLSLALGCLFCVIDDRFPKLKINLALIR